MAIKKQLFFSVGILAVATLWTCVLKPCSGEDSPPPDDAPCYTQTGYWVKRVGILLKDCYFEQVEGHRSLGYRRPYIENINCTMKCIGVRLGMIEEDGTVDETQLALFVEETVPKKFREQVWDIVAGCASFASGLDQPDKDCTKHGLLFKCLIAGFPRIYEACYPKTRRLVPTVDEMRLVMAAG